MERLVDADAVADRADGGRPQLPRPRGAGERQPRARRREPRHPRGDRRRSGASRTPRRRATRSRSPSSTARIADAMRGARRTGGGGRDARPPALGRARRPPRSGRAGRASPADARRWRSKTWAWSSASTRAGRSPTWSSSTPRPAQVDSLKTSSTPCDARARRSSTRSTRAASPRRSSTTFTHGTTVGTNALIERTGCKVAFVTTKGFEDTPFIQRINRKVLYDLQLDASRSRSSASRRLCLGARRAARLARRRGEARRRGRGAASSRARSASRGAEAVALSPALLVRPHRPRGARQGDPRARSCRACRSRSPHEVAPIWREYERSSHDDRRRLPPAAVRPLRRRASTSSLRERGHGAASGRS